MPITRRLAHRHAPTTQYHEAPISNLPIELLAEIFHIGLHDCDPDDHRTTKYLSTISSICAAWRGAALGAPSLWRRIIYTDPGDDPHKSPAIPRHAKDRLIAYLSRSKSRGIFLHLRFGASSLRIQAIKRILHPHLSRCLSICLSFMLESDMRDFLPLPGNLCRLTEFNCVSGEIDWSYRDSRGRAPPSIFAEPETVSLRKLVLERCHPSLGTINVQDLEVVRLMWICESWPESATFISRCHSLTTLIMTSFIPFDQEQPPFTLPNLTYLQTVGWTMLEVAHTPKMQTLILILENEESAHAVVELPALPALTTLCVIFGDMISEGMKTLLTLNIGIRRLSLTRCVGVSGLVRLLKADDAGSAANTMLPYLSLLQVCDSSAPGPGGFHSLFARRPTLRIEHGRPSFDNTDKSKEIVEELSQNDEPGVFEFRDHECRIFERENGLRTGSADA